MEICVSGVWGTVCDGFWDNNDARVVCRRLGFVDEREYCENDYYIVITLSHTVAAALRHARFGQGEGPILLDNLRCTGEEESLLDCHHRGIGIHGCEHYEDASVICYISEFNTSLRECGWEVIF